MSFCKTMEIALGLTQDDEDATVDLTRDELYLLDWLAKSDGAPSDALQTADAIKVALDGLVKKGLAVVEPDDVIRVTTEGWKVALGV